MDSRQGSMGVERVHKWNEAAQAWIVSFMEENIGAIRSTAKEKGKWRIPPTADSDDL